MAGKARRGTAWRGLAWFGTAGKAWYVWFGPDEVRHGKAGKESNRNGGMMTAYKWALNGLYDMDAQTVGEELRRIYDDTGSLQPKTVVDESRPDDAPLHRCFEWRDDIAAEKYRETQARHIIRNIVVVDQTPEGGTYTTRAYVHAKEDYEPLSIVLESLDKRECLIANAKRDMIAFTNKYALLKELAGVFDAMDEALGD